LLQLEQAAWLLGAGGNAQEAEKNPSLYSAHVEWPVHAEAWYYKKHTDKIEHLSREQNHQSKV